MALVKPRFFKSQAEWRAWLEKNHAKADELVIGFHKANSDKTGIKRQEAVDEALCFGWIDGRANGGDTTWSLRFTPRKPRSIWSDINLKRVKELKAEGKMHAAGLAAYEGRDLKRQKQYSFENRGAKRPNTRNDSVPRRKRGRISRRCRPPIAIPRSGGW